MTESDQADVEETVHAEGQDLGIRVSREEDHQAFEHESEPGDGPFAELSAMRTCYTALADLEESGRQRAVMWLIESLRIAGVGTAVPVGTGVLPAGANSRVGPVGLDSVPSPRDFMSQKRPQSHVERVACLAYYLSRHRSTPHFKAADIGALNTDAAGQKFGNLSRDVDNADRHSGFIVSAGKGAKQLTARGEALVEALPDREAVKLALLEYPYRQKRSSGSSKKGPVGAAGEDL